MHMHVPPKGHGPRPQVHVPIFVRAQGVYDELGRSMDDGFGARVPGDQSGKKEGLGKEGVVDFWKRLDWGPQGVSGGSEASGSGSGSGSGSSGSKGIASSSGSGSAITSASTPSSSHTVFPYRNKPSALHATQSNPQQATSRRISNLNPLHPHVPRSEWFIRKALLKKAEKEQKAAEERLRVKEEWEDEVEVVSSTHADEESRRGAPPNPERSLTSISSSNASPTRPTQSPSLASLLTLPPPGTKSYEPPTHFHIRPDNVGYKLLAKGGWSGTGGLGRPEGWEAARMVKKEVKAEEEEEERDEAGRRGRGLEREPDDVMDVDAIIDLTELDDDESRPIDVDDPATGASKFGDQQLVLADLESRAASSTVLVGPGRVAPVATYLKNDLAGIGHIPQHRRAVLAPRVIREKDGESDPNSEANKKKMKKRVTHTLADIKAMQRGKVVPGLSEEEMEKRRRGRAKRDAKRDREERKRWMEIISA